MGDWIKRHASTVVTAFAILSTLLATAAIWQAVPLHTAGWRTVTKTLPEWIGALASVATFAAFVIALVVYFDNRRQQQRAQAELITIWKLNGGESGATADNPAGWTGIRLGFINASKGLAHVQIRLKGKLGEGYSPQDHAAVKDQLVRQLFVPFMEPGNWEALPAFEDMRISLVSIEVVFRDQALNWWVRDLDEGTLTTAVEGLFPVTTTPGGAMHDGYPIDLLDLQVRRRPYPAGRGNAGAVSSEVVRRLWAIEPVQHWPQDDTPRVASPVTPEQAMQIAHIRALQAIGDAVRELNSHDA